MEYATLIVLLALLQYLYFGAQVGSAREKYGVSAPACEGDESFNRVFRIQQNTMEQLIILIPATFAFAHYVSSVWVLIPGAVFIVGRFMYSAAYSKDPKKRGPGMILTAGGNIVMVLGALGGVVMSMLG